MYIRHSMMSTFSRNVLIDKHDTSDTHTSCDQLWNEFVLYEELGGHKTQNIDTHLFDDCKEECVTHENVSHSSPQQVDVI